MQIIDIAIIELRAIEAQIDQLKAKGDNLRKEIFGIMENEGLTDGYKNEHATVSYVERKTVKINDEQKLLDALSQQKIVKYYQEIPAHLELIPDFTKDVKAGKFTHPEIEIQTSHNLAIRFN